LAQRRVDACPDIHPLPSPSWLRYTTSVDTGSERAALSFVHLAIEGSLIKHACQSERSDFVEDLQSDTIRTSSESSRYHPLASTSLAAAGTVEVPVRPDAATCHGDFAAEIGIWVEEIRKAELDVERRIPMSKHAAASKVSQASSRSNERELFKVSVRLAHATIAG
jgi:hypothetical protein